MDPIDGPLAEFEAEAMPQTIPRIAAIVAQYDGTNATDLARKICAMIFEGETIADET